MRHGIADQSATLTNVKLSAVGYAIALVSHCTACKAFTSGTFGQHRGPVQARKNLRMGGVWTLPCCCFNKEDAKAGCKEGWTSNGVPIFGGGAYWGAGGGGAGGGGCFGGGHHGGGGGGGGDDGGGGSDGGGS